MHTIQNQNFKIAVSLSSLLLIPFLACAQPENNLIQRADSLFNERQYTQSYHIYQSIFEKQGKASPAMLLKMAYIQEGVKNYTDALYYLNIYYNMTFNKRALRKMEELADKNGLKGYKVTDLEFFRNVLYKYYLYIVITLALAAWLLFAYVIHVKRKYHSRPSFSLAMIFFILLLLAFVVNFNSMNRRGLLIGDHNFVMEGPSPGSKLIDVAGKGNRIRILGHNGIWLKIRWNDRIAYVRESDVRRISM